MAAGTALIALSLTALPLAALAVASLGDGLALGHFRAALGDGRTWLLLGRSLGIALGVTVMALLLGIPLGLLLGRTDVYGRRAALLVHGFPLFLPPILIALGWFQILGRGGLVGSETTAGWLFSPSGVVAVLGLLFAPLVTGMTVLGLDGVDRSLEDAARVAARPLQVIFQVLLPLIWPSLAFASLVVASLALSEIGVPMLLRVRTYSAALFSRLGGVSYSPAEAFALATPLMVLALGALAMDRWFIGRRSFASLGIAGERGRIYRLGRARLPLSVALWLYCAVTLSPLLALAIRAGREGFSELDRWVGSSVTYSLFSAFLAASVVLLLALIAGPRLARRSPGASLVDGAAVLAFVTPAAVLAVGITTTWNHPRTQLVYATEAILVVGLSGRYLAVGLRTVAAVVARSAPSLEEAAALFGAGYLRRLARITWPLHWRGLVGAWLLTALFCLRDLETVVIFYPPGCETIPVRIFTLDANGPEAVVDALALLHVALTATVLGLVGFIARRRTSP